MLKKSRVVSVGDREADIYDLFATARAHREAGGPELLVRACEKRGVQGSTKWLWEKMLEEPVAGYRELAVPPKRGQRRRDAKLSVRFRKVVLEPPRGKEDLGKITLWAVHVRERRAPTGVEPIEWKLLTTMEVNDFAQACEKIDWYVQRWMIEVFHRTLKSGCRIEDRQLGTAKRLESCLAIDIVVAVRIMYLTWYSRMQPTMPCTVFFEDEQWKTLYCFVKKTRMPPKKVPTIREMTHLAAKLGGYLGRNSDPEPGTQVLWRGLQRVADILELARLFDHFKNGP